MPVFELYNADGSLQLDLSSRITKVLGSQLISAAGSVANEGFSKGTMFYLLSPTETSNLASYPSITVSGNTLSWTAPSTPMYLTYGIY